MSDRIDRLRAKLQEKREQVEFLTEAFEAALYFVPTPQQFHTWLSRYEVETVNAAIEATGHWYTIKCETLETALTEKKITQEQFNTAAKTKPEILAYASGCMKKMKADVLAEMTMEPTTEQVSFLDESGN